MNREMKNKLPEVRKMHKYGKENVGNCSNPSVALEKNSS